MRKLALSDEILLSVDKAARYIDGEVNSIMKDKKGVPPGSHFASRMSKTRFFYLLPFKIT